MESKIISDSDKKGLLDFVDLINKDQNKIKIKLIFKISSIDDNEYSLFKINGKVTIRHSVDESISFLDGIFTTLDIIFKQEEVAQCK